MASLKSYFEDSGVKGKKEKRSKREFFYCSEERKKNCSSSRERSRDKRTNMLHKARYSSTSPDPPRHFKDQGNLDTKLRGVLEE